MAKQQLIFVGSRWMMSSIAIIADLNGLEIKGILDHHYYGNKDSLNGIPYIGDERWLLDKNNAQAQEWLETCAFFPVNWHTGRQSLHGELDLSALRSERIRILEESGAEVINLIHPDIIGLKDLSNRYSTTTLGKGILLQASTFVGPDNNHIGDYCQIEAGSFIGHDITLGKNVQVAPKCYISNGSHITIGDNSFVGAFASFDFKHDSRVDMNIGSNVTIWTRAVVKRTLVPDNSIYTDTDKILKKIKQ